MRAVVFVYITSCLQSYLELEVRVSTANQGKTEELWKAMKKATPEVRSKFQKIVDEVIVAKDDGTFYDNVVDYDPMVVCGEYCDKNGTFIQPPENNPTS